MITSLPAPSQTVGASQPPVVTEEGQLILQGRIRDTGAAIALHAQNWDADRERSYDRSIIQSMIDNAPPVSQNLLRLAGKANCYNVNWGDGERVFWDEAGPYVSLAYSGKVLFIVPTRHGNSMERNRWSQIISEEATRTIRKWNGFLDAWMMNVIYCKRDGMSFAMFDDPMNWKWNVQSLEFVKIPSNTRLGKQNLEYVSMEINVNPHTLYAKIRNPEAAESQGWNLERTRAALMDAAPDTLYSQDWERWEEYWKNNDYLMGNNTPNRCRLIYLWTIELDGTVSQYITRREDAGKDFIFKAVGRYANMDQFLHPFIENLGSNGTYHSIRGLGHRIYSKVCALNRLVNKFADASEFDATPIIQTTADVDADDMQTIQWGAYNIFPSTYEIPDRKVPNYEQTIIPALTMFRSLLDNSTSKRSRAALQGDPGVSRYVLDAATRDDAQVSGVAEFLFYAAAQDLFKEVMRRMSAKDYDPVLPGGAEAAEFRRRCFERGVPLDAIYELDIDMLQMQKVIGGGNDNIRAVKLQSLVPMSQGLDPVGKNRFQHDLWSAMLDEQSADYYAPVQDVARLPDDAGIAQTENGLLVQGFPIKVLPGQNNEVHAMIHLQQLGEYASQVEGQSYGLIEVTVPMRRIWDHLQEHLALLPPQDPSTKQMTALSEQFEGMISNGELQLRRIAEQQAKEQEAQQGMPQEGAPQDEASTGLQLRMAERAADAQQKLEHAQNMASIKERQAAMKADLDASKIAAQKVILDMQTAAEIRRQAEQIKTP